MWKVKKGSGSRPWKIVKEDTGEVVGSSVSKEKAMASMKARYANMPEGEMMEEMPKKKMMMKGEEMMKKYKTIHR